MLDVITDFWKPATRKSQSDDKPVVFDDLQLGATIGFGFVPQAAISGRRMKVSAVNTYQFDDEKLTSYVITPEKDTQISLIVAESEGEKYLALSRRISMADRLRLFDERAFNDILTMAERKELACKDGGDVLKGWLVSNYTKQIHAFSGTIGKGDHRKETVKDAKPFDYYLLVSANNEYAIEIEKYADNRVELYATVYRRITDIGQISAPEGTEKEKVVSFDAPRKEAPKVEVAPVETKAPEKQPEAKAPEAKPEAKEEKKEEAKVEVKTEVKEEAKKEAEVLPPLVAKPEPKFSSEEDTKRVFLEPAKPEPKLSSPEPVASIKAEARPGTASSGTFTPSSASAGTQVKTPEQPKEQSKTEQKPMSLSQSENVTKLESVNGGKSDIKPANEAFGRAGQSQNGESIECELKVANKIIDEAIRSEMRLSDIVRRVVELPVANQESVQLPIALSEEDYMLLSIRYGIPSSDKNAIRRRIVEELNDFSGKK